jgi:hypothetical protein
MPPGAQQRVENVPAGARIAARIGKVVKHAAGLDQVEAFPKRELSQRGGFAKESAGQWPGGPAR